MPRRLAATILVTAALQGAAVSAVAGTIRDLPSGCDESTAVIVQCQVAELSKLNARLDKAYQAAIAATAPVRRLKLRKAQSFWLRFRAENCAFYGLAGGTFASVSAGYCMLDLTRSRATELEQAIKP